VDASHLHFLDLPNSPLAGPSLIDARQSEWARERVVQLMRELPVGAAVILPAAGETHVDHRTLRAVALRALQEVGRAGPPGDGDSGIQRILLAGTVSAIVLWLFEADAAVVGRLLGGNTIAPMPAFSNGGRPSVLPRMIGG